jgi:gallate dioxygenase
VHHQLAGIERLEGTYPFTLETSVRAYRLNRFLHRLIELANRRCFLADPEAAFAGSELPKKSGTWCYGGTGGP